MAKYRLDAPAALERIKEEEVSEKEFIERFELPYRPCAIEGVTKNWSAK